MVNILDILAKLGLATINKEYKGHIDKWGEWYRGKVEDFHRYTVYNGVQQVGVTRKSLGMAKTVCEDWANLLLNERVEIAPEDTGHAETLARLLSENNFTVRGNRLVESSFATGTGGFSEYLDADGAPRFDCHDARAIWPLTWQNGEITECAFSSVEVIDRKQVVYLRLYRWNADGTQRIENRFFDYDGGGEIPAPEGVEPVVNTGITSPLFQIIQPNINNNVDTTCPLGISVFANAIDALKSVDLVFDSWCSEYQLGRKRLIVPMSLTKQATMTLPNGETGVAPLFDLNDTVFYGMDFEDPEAKPIDHSPEIRAEQHLSGLTANLSLLSLKCGLGANRYSFDRHEGVKTATEVVSEQSDLYQSLCKHELVLAQALKGLARALLALSGVAEPGEIKVTFDDSIIQDKTALRTEARNDVTAGLMSKFRYLTEIVGMSKADANAELERLKGESRVNTEALDLFGARAGG